MAKYLVLRGTVWHIEVNNTTYGRLRESTGTSDYTHAQLVLQKRLGQAAEAVLNGTVPDKGTTMPKGGMTLAAAYDLTMREHWKINTRSSSTTEHNWKGIKKHMDVDVPLKSITRALLQQLVLDLLEDGDEPGTVNRKLSVISTILTRASVVWEILEAVPKVPTMKEPKGKRHPLTATDKANALTYLSLNRGKHDRDIADFIEVSWGLGCRLGELTKLKDCHVDLVKGTVSLWDTKNGDYRTLPITPKIKSILANRSGSGAPFGTLNRSAIDHTWARVREACGISKTVCIHSIRHSVVSRLIDSGRPLSDVMAFVGHRDIATTMKYTHMSANALSECANALAEDDVNA